MKAKQAPKQGSRREISI